MTAATEPAPILRTDPARPTTLHLGRTVFALMLIVVAREPASIAPM